MQGNSSTIHRGKRAVANSATRVPYVAIASAIVAAGLLAQYGSASMAPWLLGAAAAALGAAVVLFQTTRLATSEQSSLATAPAAVTVRPNDAELILKARAVELRAEERTKLLDALTDAVILIDAHGETRFANEAAVERFGEDNSVLGTRRALDQFPAHVRRGVLGLAECDDAARRRFEFDWLDDRHAPVVVHATRAESHPHGFVAILIRDVRVEREADRMKTEFVSKASHELRTPLSSLRAYAELLVDHEYSDDAEHDRFIRVILSEADRLSRLVDHMLDISRIESGIARAELRNTDLAALCRTCVEEQQAEAKRREISLALTRATAGAQVPADSGLLKQVVLNLLSNALKYTPDGGHVEVEVDFDALAREVVVSVRDNGLGVPADALPQLFGKFYRVAGHEKVAKGTGLGLNLCRNIVEEMHGGKIGVDSEVGRGSRFWFAIPTEATLRKAA
ncbi:MAG: Sensor histidine kinase YycG [Planctomycetota bacterium]